MTNWLIDRGEEGMQGEGSSCRSVWTKDETDCAAVSRLHELNMAAFLRAPSPLIWPSGSLSDCMSGLSIEYIHALQIYSRFTVLRRYTARAAAPTI